MSSFFKLSYNPQAFRTSLVVTLSAFALDLLFFQLIIPSNIEGINVIVLSIIYYLILFLIIRYSIEIYIKLYLERGVKKVLDELNEEILKDTYDEKDLEKLTLNLIQKARERTSEINVLKDQENYRREFLGNISHELKTPLFTIQGYILTLVEGAMKDKKVREKYLKRAAKGVERLIAIVKDLDLITQFESGIKTVDKTDFNVFDLIDNTFELMEFESEKNTISLNYDKDYSEPIFVNADQERILQVLTNLVVNSLKYGTENGFTKVSVEDFNNDKIIVKVADNGEGIDEQHLPRLFERFYRIDKNRSRKKGGSGLGLSIVKHIIEAHQEQIFVKSDLGIGTEFSFTLQKSNSNLWLNCKVPRIFFKCTNSWLGIKC
jgi:two-component system phosphate regulon sensor histidine kinase PhoR